LDLWIADSGGTKTDWVGISEDGCVSAITTKGLNPNILGWPSVRIALKEFSHQFLVNTPKEIYFFGAGLGTSDNQKQMKEILTLFLGPQSPPLIRTDLEAAAIASLGWKPGVVCILGTGSVAVQFNGNQVIKRSGGHGYLLGDEGSGSQLGLQFLRDLVAGVIEPELMLLHQDFFQRSPDQWRNEVYTASNPVPIFTDQTAFLSRYRQHPQISRILEFQFRNFFERTLLPLNPIESQPLVMLGGIAKEFRDILIKVGSVYHQNISLLQEKPVNALARHLMRKYHPNNPINRAGNFAELSEIHSTQAEIRP